MPAPLAKFIPTKHAEALRRASYELLMIAGVGWIDYRTGFELRVYPSSR